jgi:hypothetical protein
VSPVLGAERAARLIAASRSLGNAKDVEALCALAQT